MFKIKRLHSSKFRHRRYKNGAITNSGFKK